MKQLKLFLLGFIIIAGVLFLLQIKGNVRPAPADDLSIISPAKPLPAVQSINVLSGDGTMKITMKYQEKPDGSTDYSFVASDSSDKNPKIIFTKNVQKGSMALPANSWSPDNKYFFILNKENGDHYLVFKANGDMFASGGKFIDVTLLFEQKEPKLTLVEITGWDGIGLMAVRTTRSNFWFEVNTQNFIQLAR